MPRHASVATPSAFMNENPQPPHRSSRRNAWPAGYPIPGSTSRARGALRAGASGGAAGSRIAGWACRGGRPLGMGGMGIVYEVEALDTGARRAVKAILREHTRDRDAITRLEFEVRILRSLPPHPNPPGVRNLLRRPDGIVCFDLEL